MLDICNQLDLTWRACLRLEPGLARRLVTRSARSRGPGARCLVDDTVEREVEPPMAGTSQTAPHDCGEDMSQNDRPDPVTEAFVAHRNLLFTVAYEMLGSATDAEDVLQETWLRWVGVDLDAVRIR